MLPLPISRAERGELEHVLRGGNGTIHARGRLAVMDKYHRPLTHLDDWLLDGQVEWNSSADVSRTATATVLDPDGRAGLDAASPTGSSARLDRFVQMHRDVWLPSAHQWVSIPLFTGPVSGVQRDGNTITIAAQGKESLALQPFWSPKSWPRSTPRVRIIREMMRDGTGEGEFALPWWRTPAGRETSVVVFSEDDESTVWAQAQAQAKTMGAHLYYDALGVLRLRLRPVIPVWRFTEAEMVGRPTVSEDTSRVINTVIVDGGTPKAGQRLVTAKESLPASHPWSWWNLGRNGVPRRIVETISDTSIVTYSEARRVAKRRIREHSAAAWEISCDVLPVPMLEPGDLVRVDAHDVAQSAGLFRATIPLTGGLMSLGSIHPYRPATSWARSEFRRVSA